MGVSGYVPEYDQNDNWQVRYPGTPEYTWYTLLNTILDIAGIDVHMLRLGDKGGSNATNYTSPPDDDLHHPLPDPTFGGYDTRRKSRIEQIPPRGT